MSLEILKKIPRLNGSIKFDDIWDQLSPTQVVMLRYINGLAPARTIFSVLGISTSEAIEELEDMIKKGWVLIDEKDQIRFQSTGPELKPDQVDTSSSEQVDEDNGDIFDQVPDEFIDAEKEDATGKIDVSEPAANMVQVVKKARIPAMPGDMLPRFLIERYFSSEISSYKFHFEKNETMTADFFRGQMIKIVPGKPDPSYFLGIMLVKYSGVDKKFIGPSIKMRKEQGILQGEALAKLGAAPPPKIYGMLKKQAEYRLIKLAKSKIIGFKKYPGRVTEPVEMVFDWRPAVFSALWNCRDDMWLINWAENLSDCIMKRVMVDSTTMYGLGDQMSDLWRTMVISGKPVSHCGEQKALKPELAYRSLYSFVRMGIVALEDHHGENPEKDIDKEYFETEIGIAGAIRPETSGIGKIAVASEKPEGPFLEDGFEHIPDDDFLLDPDSDELDEEFGELDESIIDEGLENLPLGGAFDENEEKDAAKRAAIDVKKKKKEALIAKKKEKEAGIHFEKGMDSFVKGKWKSALSSFESAVDLIPGNGEYICFHLFSSFAISKKPEDAKITLSNLKMTKDLIPESPTPYFLIGMVYKIVGEQVKSFAAFKRALEYDPDHVGALREVRLYNMSRSAEKKSKGFFSK